MNLSLRSVVFLSLIATCVTFAAAENPREQAWSALDMGLKNTNVEKRTKAVADLGLLSGDSQAEKDAVTALQDQRSEVRAAAAQALGEMHAEGAKPQLLATLKDDDPSVIFAAAHALLTLGDDQGYDVFYAVLTGQQKSGESLLDQQKKVLNDPKKLAGLGFQAGLGFVPFGSAGYSAFKLITRDDTSPVLAAAALTLASDPDPNSGEALANAAIVEKKWLVRAAAFQAIAKRGDPKLLNTAINGLQDAQPEVQYAAAAAVIHLSDAAEHPTEKRTTHHVTQKKSTGRP